MAPPKKQPPGPSAKTEKKKLEKVIEDKTFGLKNKNKSKAVQKYMKGVAIQVAGGKIPNQDKLAAEQHEKQKQKKKAEEEALFLNSIYDAVTLVKTTELVDESASKDPSQQICEYFKAGLCAKGKKCKFSHDLGNDKNQYIDLYTDQRETGTAADSKENDTMDNWDQEKLEKVVNQNQGRYKNQTEIVCKFFLDAVEKKTYGWFWKCPNGPECIYRHCLPPGFVLQRDSKKKKDEDEDQEKVEEEIDRMREELVGKTLTPITQDIFNRWKEEKKLKREKAIEESRKKEEKKHGNRGLNVLSGRALFKYDPTLFKDDDDAADDEVYEGREEIPEEDEKRNQVPKEETKEEDPVEEAKEEEEEETKEPEEEGEAKLEKEKEPGMTQEQLAELMD